MSKHKICLLDGLTKSPCAPNAPLHVHFHGASGNGGRVGAANVPRDYRLTTLTNSPVRGEQAKAYELFDKYAETFGRQFEGGSEKSIKSFYLYSHSPGTGKTMTSSALVNEWLIRHFVGSIKRGLTPKQRPAYFLDVNSLQQKHNRIYSPASQSVKDRYGDELDRELRRIKDADFAVLDDLGVRRASESFVGILYDIIDFRTSSSKPTIFTSNLTLGELEEFFRQEDYQGKLVDRMRKDCKEIAFLGESKRK